MSKSLDSFWADILSRDLKRIQKAIDSVSEEERKAVIEHLRKMSFESGWSDGQRQNARTALEILQE